MSDSNVRTRFAPSPTGFVHIGSLRTALFSFLYARKMGGKHILRVEDTDQSRLVEGAIENLLGVMKEVGIDFDEGFVIEDGKLVEKGDHGPYLQSERLEIYKKHILELIEKGSAYYCFCSETRLDELRKEQIALKKPPMYDRLCRKLSKEDVDKKLQEFSAEGKNPVVRQAIPETGQTVIHDLIYKDILVDHKVLDDQVILKSDGFPTYHLAVVVDDHYMEISHVIRGEEWISSTPKHILLYKAFGWEPTKFAHLPLILNPDKSKLSKRQGDVSVEDFLSKGYLKEALVNFVAFLGWNPKTEQEIFSISDLIEHFDLAKINKAGAVFDLEKLDWMNGLYIRSKETPELTKLLIPYWEKAGLLTEENPEYLNKIVELEKARLKKLSDIVERTKYFFAKPDYDAEMLVWKKSTKEQCLSNLELLLNILESLSEDKFELSELELAVKNYISEKNLDTGSVLWPMRVALSGLPASPSPFEIASVLKFGKGKAEVVERISEAIDKLKRP